jgi:hypothetical protein
MNDQILVRHISDNKLLVERILDDGKKIGRTVEWSPMLAKHLSEVHNMDIVSEAISAARAELFNDVDDERVLRDIYAEIQIGNSASLTDKILNSIRKYFIIAPAIMRFKILRFLKKDRIYMLRNKLDESLNTSTDCNISKMVHDRTVYDYSDSIDNVVLNNVETVSDHPSDTDVPTNLKEIPSFGIKINPCYPKAEFNAKFVENMIVTKLREDTNEK